MPKRPPHIPSKDNRPPAGRFRTYAPESLAKSYTELPSLEKWKADTQDGRVGGWANEPMMRTIDELIQGLKAAKNEAKLYLLGQLFFATTAWVNNYKMSKKTVMVDQHLSDRKAVLSMNLYAGKELARLLKCGLGNLASRLQRIYGVEMSPHGVSTDKARVQRRYLPAAQRKIRRVFFQAQRAYLFYQDAFHPLNKLTGKGYGCVLSMSNALYCGMLGSRALSYHSFFMGGRPVRCAGDMWFNQGRITKITNGSGHYKPVDTAVVKLLNYLRMHGIGPSTITVETFAFVDKDGEIVADTVNSSEVQGDVFLRDNGNWNAILKRARHQPQLRL